MNTINEILDTVHKSAARRGVSDSYVDSLSEIIYKAYLLGRLESTVSILSDTVVTVKKIKKRKGKKRGTSKDRRLR